MTAKQLEETLPSLANAKAFTICGKRSVSMDVVEDVIKKRKSIYQGRLNYDAGYRQACDDIYLGIMDRTGGK